MALNQSRNKLNQLALNIGFEEFAKVILMLRDENILDELVDAINLNKKEEFYQILIYLVPEWKNGICLIYESSFKVL